ncbi:unnamed protein product, partial [Hapterophycus canaliculatus]
SVFGIVFFFPKGGKFKYEFQKGKPWQYENLYAPFDFSITKSDLEIQNEQKLVKGNQVNYYTVDTSVLAEVQKNYDEKFSAAFTSDTYNENQLPTLKQAGRKILDELYATGVLEKSVNKQPDDPVYLIINNLQKLVTYKDLYKLEGIDRSIRDILRENGLGMFSRQFQELLKDIVIPNVSYDKNLSDKSLAEEISKISHTRGAIDEGKLIIAKGEVVEAENFKILDSLREEYESELWAANNYYF